MGSSRNFLAPAVKFMICKAQTPSDLSTKLRFYQIQINVDCEDVVGFKYMECQTLGNIICNLFALPVRYLSVMIQRRSGTLRT